MEEKLNYGITTCCELQYKTTLTQEETAETVVPDVMPDISRILDADAAVYIRSRSVSPSGVRLEGSIQGTVLYIGEGDPCLQKLEVTMPVSVAAETDELSERDSLMSLSTVGSVEVRTLNPRKIQLKVGILSQIEVYRPGVLDLSARLDGAGLEVLRQEKTVSYIAAVEEKSILVSEEMSLPSSRPPLARLLEYSMELPAGDVKQVGGKIILQGDVRIKILYLPTEGDLPVQEEFTVSYSQIMDAPEGTSRRPR